MLHILLLILKIIGLIILILLGFLILAAVLLIFSPVCYRVRLSAGETLESLEGEAGFHWLFHLLSGEFFFDNGEVRWWFRAGWRRFGNERDASAGSDSTKVQKTEGADKTKEEKRREDDRKPPVTEKMEKEPVRDEVKTENVQKAPLVNVKQNAEKTVKLSDRPKKSSKKDKTLGGRITKWIEKIKYTFQKICDKIKSLDRKRERLQAFITNEIHKKAFSRLLREIRGLLRRLRPRRAAIDITFGFEDPSTTGYTLAGISLIYPVIGEYTNLTPDFEHRVLKGNLFIREKIRLVYFLIFAWNMLLDRNVRTTYRHLRKFKL